MTEKQAYAYGGNWKGKDWADQLVKFKNGEVLKILNSNKSSSDKEKEIKKTGKEFRRDIVLPTIIRELESGIEVTKIFINWPNNKLSQESRKLNNDLIKNMETTIQEMKKEIESLKNEKK